MTSASVSLVTSENVTSEAVSESVSLVTSENVTSEAVSLVTSEYVVK